MGNERASDTTRENLKILRHGLLRLHKLLRTSSAGIMNARAVASATVTSFYS